MIAQIVSLHPLYRDRLAVIRIASDWGILNGSGQFVRYASRDSALESSRRLARSIRRAGGELLVLEQDFGGQLHRSAEEPGGP